MDTKKIGAFIAQKRKEKGLTQEQLGEKLGVSNKTISRWENGNYMPDLSLLEPLSKELGITLNELLAGEPIEVEKAMEYSEENIISTLDYSVNKIKNERKKISVFILLIGVFLCFCAFIISPSESSWSSVYSIIGLLLATAGIFREIKTAAIIKKILISVCLFLVILSAFFVIDFIGVTTTERPPIYRYATVTMFVQDLRIIEYKNLFYHVYRLNADTPNEYYVVDTKKEYTMDTIPISPFNRERSGIENILNYQSRYVGDNSNDGALLGSLPLSEYGYVFEIDSQNLGLTVDYHFTDWYGNDNLYVEKSILYNSASIFALIENVQCINFNFSGSTYHITRGRFEEQYPNWDNIVDDGKINKDNFNKYVEAKMNDIVFVEDVLAVLYRE